MIHLFFCMHACKLKSDVIYIIDKVCTSARHKYEDDNKTQHNTLPRSLHQSQFERCNGMWCDVYSLFLHPWHWFLSFVLSTAWSCSFVLLRFNTLCRSFQKRLHVFSLTEQKDDINKKPPCDRVSRIYNPLICCLLMTLRAKLEINITFTVIIFFFYCITKTK